MFRLGGKPDYNPSAMAHEYSIREAMPDDPAAIYTALDLLAPHYRSQSDLDPHFRLAPDWRETYQRAFILGASEGRHRITLAFPDEARSGASAVCVHWIRADALLERRTTGVISELFVDASHRGRGVGRRLVVDAIRWFHQRDVSVVSLSTPIRGDGARFWQRLGFAAHSVGFECRLDLKA